MADIDKSLPNVRHEIKIPPAEAPTDVDITGQLPQQPVEVTPDQEGGATINFEPSSSIRHNPTLTLIIWPTYFQNQF